MTEAEWAVMFTASYYTPFPEDSILAMAALELKGPAAETEVETALRSCLSRGFLEPCQIRTVWGPLEDQNVSGFVLSDPGLALKEVVGKALMADAFIR
jgi:hypothetical protein